MDFWHRNIRLINHVIIKVIMNIKEIRKNFTILDKELYGRKLIYLDNGATTQVPECVLECLGNHYAHENGNIHRGAHYLSNLSTERFEDARQYIASFIGAKNPRNIVFTYNTTDSINYVATSLKEEISKGDRVIVTSSEHHSNYLPWQQICLEKEAELVVIPMTEGHTDWELMKKEIRNGVRVVAFAYVTNVTGEVAPAKEIIDTAKEVGAITLIDGAQCLRHEDISVDNLGCDFFAFSAHKMMSVGGIGILYISDYMIERMRPSRFGGGMVDEAETGKWLEAPSRFEAGTPNYQGAISLARALRFLGEVGRSEIAKLEESLLEETEKLLMEIPGVEVLGSPQKRAGVISIIADKCHPYDMAAMLDKQGIAARSGHMCAQPQMKEFGITSALRISPAFYNTEEEIEIACKCLGETINLIRSYGGTNYGHQNGRN